MRKTEGTGYADARGAARLAETATSGDRDSRRSHRCPPTCRSSIQGIVACRAWSDPDSFTASGRANAAAERRQFAHGRRLIEQMTYSHVDVRKKEIFPSSHTTTSISDEIVRGRDLPRAGFDGCLRCAAGGIVLLI